MKFTEAQHKTAIVELLGEAGYPHVIGRAVKRPSIEVLIKADLRGFLAQVYAGINDLLLDKLPDILDKNQKSNKARNLLQSLNLQGVIYIEGRQWEMSKR